MVEGKVQQHDNKYVYSFLDVYTNSRHKCYLCWAMGGMP